MKEFDWEYAEKHRNPVRFKFLKENWNKPIREEELVAVWDKSRKDSKHSKRSPSNARREYQNLKATFGFF